MSRFRLLFEWLAILCCALGVAWWAASSEATSRVDHALLDRAAVRSAPPASDDILIVAIDDRSLAEIGRWPWDRRELAKLLDRLTAGGAGAVLLDVFLSEPSSSRSIGRITICCGAIAGGTRRPSSSPWVMMTPPIIRVETPQLVVWHSACCPSRS